MSNNGGIESKDDNIKIPAEQQGDGQPSQIPEMVLTIKFNPQDGQMSVQGPGNGELYDEPLCDWLMKKAGRHIEMANLKSMQSKIITPEHRPRIRDIFRGHR